MILRGKGAGSFMQVKELMEEETMSQGEYWRIRNSCRLATSVNYSSGERSTEQLFRARTKELDLGSKMRLSGTASELT
jgi:hypothetical protein